MAKATITTVRICTASKKKQDLAADELQKQVALEKKKRELKKKQQAAEKQAEEEKKKKTDQEKADANAVRVTVLPPNNNEVIALESEDEDEMEINFNDSQDAKEDWTDTEDEEALARHGISPNHLFGKDREESIEATGTAPTELGTERTKIHGSTAVNLTAAENSPNKKKSKRAEVPCGMKASNRYTTSSFSVAKIAHKYTQPRTFVEASITMTKEDKPKEFITAIRSLPTNGQILDPMFTLDLLKHNEARTKPKLITAIDDVPVNFTHLGKYAFTSGNRIFEKKKDWKGENDRYPKSKKADHRDNMPQPETFKDPVVYFTVAIATVIPPRTLINGI
jgi:hypothetical protein